MTKAGSSVQRFGWTLFLLVLLGGGYLFLRARPGGSVAAVFVVLLAAGLILIDLIGLGVRRQRRRRGQPQPLTLPWYLLRRALDVGVLVTIGFGIYLGATSHDSTARQAGSTGTLSFVDQQTQINGTLALPAGQTAVWFAVHCADCYHPDRLHKQDDTVFPTQTGIEVTSRSGATAVRVEPLSGVRAHVDETTDRFGVREQQQIALLHVTTPGTYSVRVLLNPGYFRQRGNPATPGSYATPAPGSYADVRILFGQPPVLLLGNIRLKIIAALLALSVLVGLRPRTSAAIG